MGTPTLLPGARTHGQPLRFHHHQVVVTYYTATGRCFDSRIRQLLLSRYHSPIQLPRCTRQSDIPAQATVSLEENNVKCLIHVADLESWHISMYAQPPNMLPPPIFLSPKSLGQALAPQPTPNFPGYTLIGFDTESIMATDLKNFQFTVPMPANSMGSSYPQYIQLAFPNGTMFVYETFNATPEDWTTLFSLVDGEHTIIVSFDGADDWAGIYALLGTQFQTDRQEKNKDPVKKSDPF
uniref:Uncharacterized protein n=1 Tax=Romanomermis culicivorax TaxID=13658 RepID=A0A915HIK4_ROMCU